MMSKLDKILKEWKKIKQMAEDERDKKRKQDDKETLEYAEKHDSFPVIFSIILFPDYSKLKEFEKKHFGMEITDNRELDLKDIVFIVRKVIKLERS
jgi:hypothetical protein